MISIVTGSDQNKHLHHIQQIYNTLVVERSKCFKILSKHYTEVVLRKTSLKMNRIFWVQGFRVEESRDHTPKHPESSIQNLCVQLFRLQKPSRPESKYLIVQSPSVQSSRAKGPDHEYTVQLFRYASKVYILKIFDIPHP